MLLIHLRSNAEISQALLVADPEICLVGGGGHNDSRKMVQWPSFLTSFNRGKRDSGIRPLDLPLTMFVLFAK